jgi:hypothetical protein
MISQLMTRAMEDAKVPAKTQEKVLEQAEDFDWVDGLVIMIQTADQVVDAFVAGSSTWEHGKMQKFSFPPNATDYLEELKRAQSLDRSVTCAFKPVNGVNSIIFLDVYTGKYPA